MIHPTTWPDWMPLQPETLQGGWLHMRLVFDPLLQQLGRLRGVTHSSLIGEHSFPPDRYTVAGYFPERSSPHFWASCLTGL